MDPTSELAQLREAVEKLAQRVARLESLNAKPATKEPAAVAPEPVLPREEVPPVFAATPPAPLTPAPSFSTTAPEEPNLESRIGSHWLNRIGITALLIGVAYFLKLAFDNEWIGPTGRIAIGLAAGIGLVLWSERFYSKGYKAFSHSITAAGSATLYLSLWAAFQLYHLLPGAVAFVAMMIVTAFMGLLAIRRDAELIAVVALVGGFSTPILLSTGENRPIALFSYVLLLDVATVLLVALRPWGRLLLLSFLGTLSLYTGWALNFNLNENRPVAAAFTTAFFVVFAILPLLKPMQQGWAEALRESGLPRTMLMLAVLNAAAYFLEIYILVESLGNADDIRAFSAVLLGAFYIVLAMRLRAVNNDLGVSDLPNAQLNPWLHAAIGLGLLTVAIPLKLHSHWVTIGWFLEAAAILYVAHRGRSTFLRNAAVCALALGVARLLFIDNFHTEHVIFNARFATYLIGLAVLGGIAYQLRSDTSNLGGTARTVASVAFNCLALVALGAEIQDFYSKQMVWNNHWADPLQMRHNNDLGVARDFTFSALGMAYGAALMIIGFWKQSAMLRWQAIVLLAATIAKVFLYDVRELSSGFRVLSFIVLGALLLAVSFAYQKDWIKLAKDAQ